MTVESMNAVSMALGRAEDRRVAGLMSGKQYAAVYDALIEVQLIAAEHGLPCRLYRWSCDRCGDTSAIEDVGMPGGWAHVKIAVPIGSTKDYDLCARCVEAAVP